MGPSCPPTEPSTRRATAKKPYESFPRCGNDDRFQGETPERRHSKEHPPTLRAIPRPLQGLRDRRRGPRDFRTEDEVRPPRAQRRVLLFEMWPHGRQPPKRPTPCLYGTTAQAQTVSAHNNAHAE